MNRLGIVTGLLSEARCLKDISGAGLVEVRCAGADARRAEAMARGLAEGGCAALASFGLAGGLQADLHPGDVILAERLIGGNTPLQPDGAWLAAVRVLLREEMRVTVGIVAGTDAAVSTPWDKRCLHERTGAVAVDIESLAVAATAQAFRLPFLAVRVIADSARHRVPDWLPGVIDEAGAVCPAAFCGGVLKRPQDLADIFRLAGANRRALASLRRVAALLGPGFGFL